MTSLGKRREAVRSHFLHWVHSASTAALQLQAAPARTAASFPLPCARKRSHCEGNAARSWPLVEIQASLGVGDAGGNLSDDLKLHPQRVKRPKNSPVAALAPSLPVKLTKSWPMVALLATSRPTTHISRKEAAKRRQPRLKRGFSRGAGRVSRSALSAALDSNVVCSSSMQKPAGSAGSLVGRETPDDASTRTQRQLMCLPCASGSRCPETGSPAALQGVPGRDGEGLKPGRDESPFFEPSSCSSLYVIDC